MIAGPLAGLNKLMNRKTFRAELEREQDVSSRTRAGHVVFLGFNEIGAELAEFFRLEQEGQNITTTSHLLH